MLALELRGEVGPLALDVGLAGRPGRVPGPRRALGRREDLRAADGRRARPAGARPGGVRGRGVARHRARDRACARPPPRRDALPGLRAVSQPRRVAKRGLRHGGSAAGRAARARARAARALRALASRRCTGHDPVGGRAPAGGARPRARPASARAAARRAAVGPRLPHPGERRPRAGRAAGRCRGARHPGHPRLRGGRDAGRSHRRDGRRQGGPDGCRRRADGPARVGVRGRPDGLGGAVRRRTRPGGRPHRGGARRWRHGHEHRHGLRPGDA